MYYENEKNQFNSINRRTFFLYLIKLSFFSIVGWRLYNIQILDSKKYKTLSKNNQIDLEILFPLRGEIYDRNNNLVATNKKVYDLYLIPEKTASVNSTLNGLSKYINIDFAKKRKIIDLSKKVKKFEKIKIIENIDWSTLEKIESNKYNLPGIIVIQDFMRIYPYNEFFSHILGYISKPNQKDLALPFVSKMPNLDIGQEGLEKAFNIDLVGLPGQREIEVNSNGRVIREISREDSKKGKAVKLTIDNRIQEYALNILRSYRAGSIVVMDIATGHILCMASVPTYDANKIIQKPNKDYWEKLLNNKLSPLTFRSIQGLYAPGSTFKMIVAIAALKHGIIDKNSTTFCNGKIEFGDRLYHCWKTKGHGNMNVVNGIKESCDIFFYELAKKLGIERIAEVAFDFGLGTKYEINLDNQKKGIVPTKKWKKENVGESWYAGETLITGIGQGYVLANPLQLAVMTSTIASNGKIVKPTLTFQNNEFEVSNKYTKEIDIIKEAMFKVVNEYKGTAFKSKMENLDFSGKTGTSQVTKISLSERESEDFRKKEIEWKNRDHALFVGYMPSKKPKYSISVIVEHGGSGASTAAPIAKQVFSYINDLKI
tara:strand:+ start:4357 stop:6153 length:1797 start_codon:yes stop_codon:yes gene_type:complete